MPDTEQEHLAVEPVDRPEGRALAQRIVEAVPGRDLDGLRPHGGERHLRVIAADRPGPVPYRLGEHSHPAAGRGRRRVEAGRGSANRSRVLGSAEASGPAFLGRGDAGGGSATSMRAEIRFRSAFMLLRRVCISRSSERSDRFIAESPRIRFRPVLTRSPMKGVTPVTILILWE